MLAHEEKHFEIFETLRRERNWRQCNALPLWSLGGFALGIFTGLFGKAGVWVCTYAVEPGDLIINIAVTC